jgi:MSHA biogenesis protein MshQ
LKRILLFFFFSLPLLAPAATYNLPAGIGAGPFAACALASGTTYNCTGSVTILNNDVVNVTSTVTLNVAATLNVGNNATFGTNGQTLNVIASASINIGDNSVSFANFTLLGTNKLNIKPNAVVTGNLAAPSGTVDLSNNTTVFGNVIAATIQSNNGAVVYGNCAATSCQNNCNGTAAMACTTNVTVPLVTTVAASTISATSATLNGTVTPNQTTATVKFNYGTTLAYGTTVNATPASLTASATGSVVTYALAGLTCNTTYHFRAAATNTAGTTNGGDLTFTTTACPSAVNHYEISIPASSISCIATPVTVTACANATNPCTSTDTTTTGTPVLAASAGTVTTGTFTNGISSGLLSYPAAANNATVTISLINPVATTSCKSSTGCSTTFSTAGFIFSSTLNGAVATIPMLVGGTTSATYYLRAVQSNTTTGACTAALTTPTTVDFAYQCNNPTTCSSTGNLMSINSTPIQGNPNTGVANYLPVPLTFDGSGNAPFTFKYSDVGQVTLFASKAAVGSLLTSLAGTSNSFVVSPSSFVFSGLPITNIKAGNNFTGTLTAKAGASIALNFGNENLLQSVILSATKFQPTGGNSVPGIFSGTATFSSGVATINNLNFSEVGIIDLNATLSTYLGSATTTTGTTGSAGAVVPAFIPDHFNTSVTDGVSCPITTPTTSCVPASGFTYSGQPFTIFITAMNGLSAKTLNYDGTVNTTPNFAHNAWLIDANTAATPVGRLGISGATMGVTADVAGVKLTVPSSNFTQGVATLTSVLTYTLNVANTAPTTIKIRSVDSINNTVASSGFAEGTTEIRSGRFKVSNAFGSELLPLLIPVTVQFYDGKKWTQSMTDSTTKIDTNLTTGVTGNINRSGMTLTVNSPSVKTISQGSSNLTFAAPNLKGNAVVNIVTSSGNEISYLLTNSIVGQATFGVYQGRKEFIYLRENY